MKSNITIFALGAMLVFASCGGGKKSSETASETPTTSDAPEVTYTVSPAESTVAWKGEVAGVYGHNGVINISDATISAKGNTLTGGKVVIDMTSIQPTDSASYTDGKTPQDLVDHLSTGDFFLVEEYPTATFVIKSHTGDKLIGDLTVRGITKEEEATITSLNVTESGLTGSADLVFDRQDYDVKWVHFMKDMVLSDDIQLTIDLTASAK